MKKPAYILVAAAALALMGQSCTPAKQTSSLPSAPPDNAFMQDQDTNSDSMMKDDSSTDKQDDTMMKDDEKDDAMMKNDSSMKVDESTKDNAMMKDDASKVSDDSMKDDSTMKDTKPTSVVPYYISYSAAEQARALAAKKVTLLYFYAPWCPICQVEEPKIKSWVEGSALNVGGFRVDYDNETALKQKYGVTSQHTTIIFNTKGEESTRFVGPMDQATLISALTKASQI